MDLNEKQAELDKRKYIRSEKAGKDLGGKMRYCKGCKHNALGFCKIFQEQREKETACAVAWANMYRG